PGSGTGGDDDVLACDRLLLPVLECNLDLAAAQEPAAAVEMGDLVLLEEGPDALREPVGNVAGPFDCLGEIRLDLAHLDPELGGVSEVRDHRRTFEQRLGRYTADVETDTAKELFLDAKSAVSELSGLDCGDVSRRSPT